MLLNPLLMILAMLAGCQQLPIDQWNTLLDRAKTNIVTDRGNDGPPQPSADHCPQTCQERWQNNPTAAVRDVEIAVIKRLNTGEPEAAEAILIHAKQALTYYAHADQQTPYSAQGQSLATQAIPNSSPGTSPISPLSTVKAGARQTNWPRLEKRLNQLAQSITDFRQMALQTLTSNTDIHRARWLQSEVQRLQLRVNQKGIHPIASLQLKLRQREAQSRLRDALSQLTNVTAAEDFQTTANYEAYINLLVGQPPADSSALTQNLLAQGYAPVQAAEDIQEALSTARQYFAKRKSDYRPPTTTGATKIRKKINTQPVTIPSQPAATIEVKTPPEEPAWIELSKSLDQAMRNKDLPGIQDIIRQLNAQEELPISQRMKVEAMENFLEQQISSLDAEADALYQQGQISDAKRLWQILLDLKPTDSQLAAKVLRAEKVLDNLDALRERNTSP